VKLTRSEPSGRQVLVGLRAPGWLLGAAAAPLGLPHPITAETVTTCALRQLAKGDYLTLLETNIRVSHWVQRMQARQTYEQIVLLGTLGALSPRQRLEQFLVHQIPSGSVALVPGLVQLTLPLLQQELAQAIGVSPEHLSRLLKQLDVEGLIVRRKGRLQIPNDSVLLRRALDLASLDG
jgi:CRP/FNR family transcriptional regulator